MSLLASRQPLLERQSFTLLRLHLYGRGVADGRQIALVQTGLLSQFLAVAPLLNLPGAADCQQRQCERADQDQLQHGRSHGTSLKKMWCPRRSVSLAPFTQPGGLGMVVA